jgi:hypothetical protein
MAGASINQIALPSTVLLVQNPASDGLVALDSKERQPYLAQPEMSVLPHTRCIVLIPAGPATVREHLNDTIESAIHYIGSNCTVAVIDDSREDRFAYVANVFRNAVVMKAIDCDEGKVSKTRGALFAKQVHTLKRLRRQYRFDILLRMDTDALMIGHAPHEDALRFVASHPDVGMIGAFKRRGDGSDKTPAMAAKGRELAEEIRFRHGIKHFRLVRTLRRLMRHAEGHGYTRGDMCTGGAFFLTPAALTAMEGQGLLDLDVLRHSTMADDLLLALLCCAAGYRLSDLPEDNDVLAINWRRFPMPVEILVSSNKKIVHPVKDDDLTVEPRVRAYFRQRRQDQSLTA